MFGPTQCEAAGVPVLVCGLLNRLLAQLMMMIARACELVPAPKHHVIPMRSRFESDIMSGPVA